MKGCIRRGGGVPSRLVGYVGCVYCAPSEESSTCGGGGRGCPAVGVGVKRAGSKKKKKKRRGLSGSGTQKWPQSVFPSVDFPFPHCAIWVQGGGGGPVVVSRSNTSLSTGPVPHSTSCRGGGGMRPWCWFICLWRRLLASRHCTSRPSVSPNVLWLCRWSPWMTCPV